MLLFVRDKKGTGADEKMLLRLDVRHEFLHSNKTDVIEKRIFMTEKQKKLPYNKRKAVSHIIFDVNFMFEQNDTDFFSLLERIKNEEPDIEVTLYYYSRDEYLLSRNIEVLQKQGYNGVFVADDENDFLKKLNSLITDSEMSVQSTYESKQGCVGVGVLGGCPRIGTTTQAMQLLMFLQNSGYRVGLIQWEQEPDINVYVDIIDHSRRYNHSEFVINGLHFYGKEDLKLAINDNDFLIFDFGSISVLDEANRDFFLEQDIKIAVLGVKSKEIAFLPQVFDLDKGEGERYIYSFTAPEDREGVKGQMDSRSKDTYFADYTPDYFVYSNNDTMYSKILGIALLQKTPQSKLARGIRKNKTPRSK